MKNAIAIGMLGLALGANNAAAQTSVEQARILSDFQRSVVDYTERHKCLAMFPEAISANTPAPQVFTLPVAMVFRQMIARAVAVTDRPVIGGIGTRHHAAVLRPFPTNELYEFPRVLSEALPLMPAPLEYRLIGNDLVIRDAEADFVVAVLRDALGTLTTRH